MTFVDRITAVIILEVNIRKNSKRLEELMQKDRSGLTYEENRREEQRIRKLKANIEKDRESLCLLNAEL